ncbi:MAG: precorrin-6y C5,15-methyltransferase (decarboxylating) subunit CbiE [Caldimicrobium sp.]|nr:precorrin-6y C5,15-methyltransferase (decarboxylating) subunit CbiE [Caldimicrobium sp.]MCX7613997.1 precorrin-6y C5,15-methyltransferase (decarboxylating) subunit CbiE [Caldimicrobium sp.]MDW8182864.1 precorrin-6y C5,15-methyltransferase (decarboxylating) subunit CbiE [Caldimicrobium sp.]
MLKQEVGLLNAPKIHLIGFSYRPFSEREVSVLKRCSKVYLFSSALDKIEKLPFEILSKLTEVKKLSSLISSIQSERKEVAILVTGDPLFFGLGETLLKHFPKEYIEVHPDLSTMQVLCARLKVPTQDVRVLSFHGRSFDVDALLKAVKESPYLFIFTDSNNPPNKIAEALLEVDQGHLKIYIGERLGTDQERILEGKPNDFIKETIFEPNCLLVENPKWWQEARFGLTEVDIEHRDGMITKDEIRAVVVHRLKIPQGGIFWDIGAGSGSISLEVARLFPLVRTYAIEKDPSACETINRNKRKFYVSNLEIVQGEAPSSLNGLPYPQRVFLGGSGGKLDEILGFLRALPSLERIVATFVCFNNLQRTLKLLKEDFLTEVTQLQINRARSLRDNLYLKAENPIFIFCAHRKSIL